MADEVVLTEAGSHNLAVEGAKTPIPITDPRVATRTYQQYLGALTLLGHALARNNRPDDYQQSRVFTDANNVLRATGSDIRYRRTSSGGWAAFVETPDAPAASPRK